MAAGVRSQTQWKNARETCQVRMPCHENISWADHAVGQLGLDRVGFVGRLPAGRVVQRGDLVAWTGHVYCGFRAGHPTRRRYGFGTQGNVTSLKQVTVMNDVPQKGCGTQLASRRARRTRSTSAGRVPDL